MQARTAIIVLAVAAIAYAVLSGGSDDKKDGNGGGGQTTTGAKAPAGSVKVTFFFSPEKEKLLLPLVKEFNGKGEKAGGKPIFIDAQNVSSGAAEDGIAKQKLKPTAWSPSSSLWGRLLNYQADASWVADDNPSIVRTPLVIAMWEPLARALGWPRKKVGFGEILELALSPRGWADKGRPEYGRFKLGHTNPDFSTSGLSAVAAEYYAVAGKREGLTEEDIGSAGVRSRIRSIEQSIVHYGDTTLFFADQMKKYGPAYASAVAMEEVTLIDFNRGRKGTKLVALYPREGTFFSDNPYMVLDAPWVSAAQSEGAKKFGEFLADEVTPEKAAAAGFRPGDPDKKPLAPVNAQFGANPSEPKTVLSLPEPRVLARIKTGWRADRKAANVMLVVDTSGSMGEEDRLEEAKNGLQVFFRNVSPRDRIGLLSFNSKVFPEVPVREFAQNKQPLIQKVGALLPDGETAVYDATGEGYDAIRKLNDDTRINAVVVLTDGQDNQSDRFSAGSLVEELGRQSQAEGGVVRVFTIAYGAGANEDVLKKIAAASGGQEFSGDPDEIEAVYKSISSFF